MIKLDRVHIEEMRGIRKLDIEFGQGNFAISGPNGSGKSGVIDALEFALTGQMSRLSGRGTKGITIAEHGPHVDMTRFPDAAFVEVDVWLPTLKKTAKIHRKVSAPRKPVITPDDPDVRAVLAEAEQHPEVALSRREVLRFILIEPTKRSEEVQAVLKLEAIGQLRGTLNAAQNKLASAERAADGQAGIAREALRRHLNTDSVKPDDVLDAVNAQRQILDLPVIAGLTAETRLDEGIDPKDLAKGFDKASALRDVGALQEAIGGLGDLGRATRESLVRLFVRLSSDPALMSALHRHSLLEKGLELVNGAECPLCGKPWDDEEHLRSHLRDEIAKSKEAAGINAALTEGAAALKRDLDGLLALLTTARKLTQPTTAFGRVLDEWQGTLSELRGTLGTVDGLASLQDQLAGDFWPVPDDLIRVTGLVAEAIEARPDQSATAAAQGFLTVAQLRLEDLRQALKRRKDAAAAAVSSKRAYDLYCEAMEGELDALYQDVQADFSRYYRIVNDGDEQTFTAKLKPSAGKLDLDVNFYERGLFPPAAYHSEGHQDGMGVCLYLALMKRLLGDNFTLALLDDVVMSVDTDHRLQFCRLLKSEFPGTQFMITTHDKVWAEQMRHSGLVTSKTSMTFHGWSVETGPLVESDTGIWKDIEESLAKGKVGAAAHALRSHLEFASRQLADQLGATVVFRGDGNHDLGQLLPAVLAQMAKLWRKAGAAAQSWSDNAAKTAAEERAKKLSMSNGTAAVEQWAINKAVHYNEWANFGANDFKPVVAAFRDLLAQFQCSDCGSWFYVTGTGPTPDTIRCNCPRTHVNLKEKDKS